MSTFVDFFGAGRRIAELRGGLTQAEFAARLGVDRKTVVRWEAGERLPDGASLVAFATEFNADITFILTGRRAGDVPATPSLTAEQRLLLERYEAADATGRKMAQRVLGPDPVQAPVTKVARRGRKAA